MLYSAHPQNRKTCREGADPKKTLSLKLKGIRRSIYQEMM
jgi:hypothetical protein